MATKPHLSPRPVHVPVMARPLSSQSRDGVATSGHRAAIGAHWSKGTTVEEVLNPSVCTSSKSSGSLIWEG